MRYAMVKSGEVVNVFECDAVNLPDIPGALFISSETAGTGWLYADGAFRPPLLETPVPDAVTDLQFRLALIGAGIFAQAEAFAAAAPDDVKVYWERALEIRRDHPFIAAAATALGLGPSAIDAIFVDAASR